MPHFWSNVVVVYYEFLQNLIPSFSFWERQIFWDLEFEFIIVNVSVTSFELVTDMSGKGERCGDQPKDREGKLVYSDGVFQKEWL